MKKYLVSIVIFLAVLISACTTTKPTTNAWLTKETKVNLPISYLGQSYHDQQLLTFKYNDQENSIIALIDVEQNNLTVVGLTTLGIRLFKIEYNDNKITTEQNIFVKELPPASQILADIMLSIWPIQEWQAVLPQGWQLVDGNLSRKLLNDKQETIIEITYNQKLSEKIRKPTYIKHNIFGYQIAIQNMEQL